MTKRIFRSTLTVAAAVLLASLAVAMGGLSGYFRSVQEQQLRDELRLAAYGVEEQGKRYLELLSGPDYRYSWAPDYRLTWVDSAGTVLFDTAEEAGTMENHGDREEIREAFASGEGSSVRSSATLTRRTVYYARALRDGTVLRISASQMTLPALVLAMLQPILLVGMLAVILSAVLARGMAKKIVRPLNALDLDNPLENDAYEELTPLLSRIHQQRQQIAGQLRDLQKKTDEFEQVTRHMREGLILLDDGGEILSINPAARRIFGGEGPLERGTLAQTIQGAQETGHSQTRMERGGREFQLDISRIASEDAAAGTVLLAFDVTEQAAAERSRREFTANVSHELKTPLQSILGSAELLQNGLVRPEDVPQFSGLIHREAARLVALVEDIIHLSQQDEGVPLPREPVDLLELAEQTAAGLEDQAARKGVRLTVTGEHVQVLGAAGFLHEMVYNLCDNAIKYNVEGGSVDVCVWEERGQAQVRVQDTGIGIPPEDQDRVFQRFFRVDKSRSKASGGTGLGLSIVKHIVQYHGGTLSLESTPGAGTAVTVTLPLA